MNEIKAFFKAKFLKIPIPYDIVIEITHKCNLNCIYCDRHTPAKRELTTKQVLDILSEFHAIGTRGLSIDGGEPLTRKDLPEIIDYIKKLGMNFRLNTNGTLLADKIDWIKGAEKIKISLDGGIPEYHDSMRGKGSFEKTIKGIYAAKMAGMKVELTCVLHRYNLKGVQKLLEVASHLDCPVIFQPARNSLFNFKSRNGSKWSPDYLKLHKTFLNLLNQKKRNKYIANKKASLIHFLNFPQNVKIPCAAGWLNCTIDPEGNIYHCGEINRNSYKINILEYGVEKAFNMLPRFGCCQCWCARTVEENYLWGLKLQKFI